jgi:hypothetical protein
MRNVLLERLETGDAGTFGRITADGLVLYTGELPDRDNAANVSCIPAGTYTCSYTYSPRFRRLMYGIEPVPGRAGVRIHSANFMGDSAKGLRCQLNGCIALGERLGKMDGQKAVLLSAPAVRRFVDLMAGETFKIEVR